MIRTIIIEDEANSSAFLQNILSLHFKNVEVIAVCRNNAEAKAAVEQLNPELVFSDIELEGESVFDMLQQLEAINFEVIFITAFEKYAIRCN